MKAMNSSSQVDLLVQEEGQEPRPSKEQRLEGVRRAIEESFVKKKRKSRRR